MPKRSNEFQRLIFMLKQVVAPDVSVIESKMLPDIHTGTEREVDICIEGTLGGHDILICLECRDHKRPADVGWVQSMKRKHDDLPTNALYLVSRSGFTSEAQKKAKAYNIEVLELSALDIESIDRLFGLPPSLWGKSITLTPIKVSVAVPATQNLPPEIINAFPDNSVFDVQHSLIGTMRELVQFFIAEKMHELLLNMDHASHNAF